MLKVFDRYISLDSICKSVIAYFANSGWGIKVSDGMLGQEYLEDIQGNPRPEGNMRSLGRIRSTRRMMASAAEFILEGLHLHQKLNKEVKADGRPTVHNVTTLAPSR